LEWNAHLTQREDPLVLEDDGDFDEREAEVVHYDTPKKVLNPVSRCAEQFCGAGYLQDLFDPVRKWNEDRVLAVARVCLCT